MPTVLHLIETGGPGGAEKTLVAVAEGLAQTYRGVVYALKEGWTSQQMRARGFPVIVPSARRTFDLEWIMHLARTARSHQVDLVHAHEFTMNTVGTLVATWGGFPIVTTVHGKNYYWQRARRRLAYRWVSRRSHMVAVSEDVRRFLIEQVGVAAHRVTRIYNGIDVDAFEPRDPRREVARRALGIDPEAPVVACVGNLYPVKGHIHLVRAVALLRSRIPQIQLLVAGRGDLLEPLSNECGALGVDAHVRFLGFQEDVRHLLAAADVFTLPSLSEGLPLSALEAMAMERPVVATRVGGIPEVVEDGVSGFLVPPEDPDSLAGALADLLQDADRRRAMGRAGRARVEGEFSVARMLAGYRELYEAAMATGTA